jgi:hypothetical protein
MWQKKNSQLLRLLQLRAAPLVVNHWQEVCGVPRPLLLLLLLLLLLPRPL